MAFIIGLSVRLVKKGYKAYKQHQDEKEMRSRETPHAISDPSHELSANPSRRVELSSNPSRRAELPGHNSSFTHHRNSSSSSISSDSSATQREAELALENDAEFRQFMERQKQMYLSQQRVPRGHSTAHANSRSVVSELPSSTVEPPAYSAVMEEDAWVARSARSATQPSATHMTTAHARTESDDKNELVSPVSPNTRSRVSEIDGTEVSPVTPSRPSTRAISELPATPPES